MAKKDEDKDKAEEFFDKLPKWPVPPEVQKRVEEKVKKEVEKLLKDKSKTDKK
jgi:hypothetical protein